MHSRFYLSLLLVASVVVLGFMGLATFREMSTEWQQHQAEYKDYLITNAKDDAAKKRAERIETGIRQVFISSLKKADRCTSCHIGVENPMMTKVDHPYKVHPGNFLENHSVAKFGCTICHYGQGRATNCAVRAADQDPRSTDGADQRHRVSGASEVVTPLDQHVAAL